LGTTYHSKEWVNVHKRSLGAQIVQLVAREEGKMVGVFPFAIRPRSMGQIFGFETSFIAKEVASPPAVMENPYGGPVCDPDRPDVFGELLKASVKVAGPLARLKVKFSPAVARNASISKALPFSRGQVSMLETLIIDLDRPWDAIRSGFKKRVRSGVKKAKDCGVEVFEATDDSSVRTYHKILTKTYNRSGFSPYPEAFYKDVFNAFLPGRQAKLLLANYQGQPIAGAFFLMDRNTAYYWTGAFLREFDKVEANALIQATMIEKAKISGFSTYDMTGIDAFHPGISLFKAGFGGQLCRFPSLSWESRASRQVRRLLRTLTKYKLGKLQEAD
jgi:hypothetical protein